MYKRENSVLWVIGFLIAVIGLSIMFTQAELREIHQIMEDALDALDKKDSEKRATILKAVRGN